MAIYHFHAQMIKRSEGRSATAAAAYRAGEEIVDRSTGEVWNYRRKKGIYSSEILAPDHAPKWVFNRSELWNRVEESETRQNSQLARELNISVPIELPNATRVQLVREFVRDEFVAAGMVADVCFHDFESHNPHAHVSLTLRDIHKDGFSAHKNRTWNERTLMDRWRESWANYANRYIQQEGFDIRIDHRSYEEQGIDLIPTRHLGPHASALENAGTRTQAGDLNRAANAYNTRQMNRLVTLEFEAQAVEKELKAIEANIERRKPARISHSQPLEALNSRAAAGDKHWGVGQAVFLASIYKAKLFERTWKVKLPLTLTRVLGWVDVDARAVTLRSGAEVVDKGREIVLSSASADALQVLVTMVKAKKMQRPIIEGPVSFQIDVAKALYAHNIAFKFESKAAREMFLNELCSTKFPATLTTSQHLKLDRLVKQVFAAMPLPSSRGTVTEHRKLRNWANDRWGEVLSVAKGDVSALREIFNQAAERSAISEGYSNTAISEANLATNLVPCSKTRPALPQKDRAPGPPWPRPKLRDLNAQFASCRTEP